jgi:hypothetical protein
MTFEKRWQLRLVSSEVALVQGARERVLVGGADRRGEEGEGGGGNGVEEQGEGSVIAGLCRMMQEAPVCGGEDPVGNGLECHAASAAVAALHNLLAENETACTLAIKAGAIDSLKLVLKRWMYAMHRVSPPELPSEGEEDSSDEENEGREGVAGREGGKGERGEEGGGGGGGGQPRAEDGARVGKALVLALGAGGEKGPGGGPGGGGGGDAGEGDSGNEVAHAGGVDGDEEKGEEKEHTFEALPSEVTWTEEWWREERAMDACRAAWCLRSLSFREHHLLIEEDVEGLLRRAIRMANDVDTDTALTWALIALRQ